MTRPAPDAAPARAPADDDDADDPESLHFVLHFRNTFNKDYSFNSSYRQVPGARICAAEPWFPAGMFQFLNLGPGSSASFFLFREDVRPVYDDPAHRGGGEFSIYLSQAEMNEPVRTLVGALLDGSITRADSPRRGPYRDITGLSLTPKHGGHLGVKIWVRGDSKLRGLPATEVFPLEFHDLWKVRDTIYMPFASA